MDRLVGCKWTGPCLIATEKRIEEDSDIKMRSGGEARKGRGCDVATRGTKMTGKGWGREKWGLAGSRG